MRAIIAIGAVVLLAASPATRGDHVHVRPRINRIDHAIPTASGKEAHAVEFRFNARDVVMRAIGAVSLKPEGRKGGTGISVRDAVTLPPIKTLGRSEMLFINGGFSGTETSRPVGLLIANGRTLSLPEYNSIKGNPADSCGPLRVDHYNRGAIACAGADGVPRLERLASVNVEECREAVQSGPILVEKESEVGVCGSSGTGASFVRTALCTAGDDVSVIVTTEPVTLLDLARWLAAYKQTGGLGCSMAMNLSGDTSTGAAYFPGGNRLPEIIGPATFPQASFLAFVVR